MAGNSKPNDTPGTGTTAKASDTRVVRYVGIADVRAIDANAWKNAGVEDQTKVVWDAKNKFTVPASDLSEAALKYVDEMDTGFVVEDTAAKG